MSIIARQSFKNMTRNLRKYGCILTTLEIQGIKRALYFLAFLIYLKYLLSMQESPISPILS